jgi:putative spermidine/putrescine transport system substrate-binding protein/spermidine/putrescine transport system substrate-binding protein
MKNLLLLLAALFVLSISLLSCGGKATETKKNDDPARFKGQSLNILCWEGYADEKFTKAFQDKYGVTVKGTYFGTEDEMISKLQADNASGAYDLVSPSCDFAGYLVQADLVEAIDTSKITAWNNLAPRLRAMMDVRKANNIYGVPFTWGPDYLIYNADVIKEAPTSWKILWDPKYKGKVSVPDDIVNIYTTGLVAGMANTDKSAIYNMTEAQLQTTKAELTKLQTNVRKYWATAGELDNMFKNKEVVLGLGWPLSVNTLQGEGMNIKAVIPSEGATGWIDRLMLVKGTKNKELATLWLDYISQAEQMAKVAEVTTYSVANAKAADFMSEALKKSTYAGNENFYFEKLNWWQFAKDRKRYNEVWNEVKAGTK